MQSGQRQNTHASESLWRNWLARSAVNRKDAAVFGTKTQSVPLSKPESFLPCSLGSAYCPLLTQVRNCGFLLIASYAYTEDIWCTVDGLCPLLNPLCLWIRGGREVLDTLICCGK